MSALALVHVVPVKLVHVLALAQLGVRHQGIQPAVRHVSVDGQVVVQVARPSRVTLGQGTKVDRVQQQLVLDNACKNRV